MTMSRFYLLGFFLACRAAAVVTAASSEWSRGAACEFGLDLGEKLDQWLTEIIPSSYEGATEEEHKAFWVDLANNRGVTTVSIWGELAQEDGHYVEKGALPKKLNPFYKSANLDASQWAGPGISQECPHPATPTEDCQLEDVGALQSNTMCKMIQSCPGGQQPPDCGALDAATLKGNMEKCIGQGTSMLETGVDCCPKDNGGGKKPSGGGGLKTKWSADACKPLLKQLNDNLKVCGTVGNRAACVGDKQVWTPASLEAANVLVPVSANSFLEVGDEGTFGVCALLGGLCVPSVALAAWWWAPRVLGSRTASDSAAVATEKANATPSIDGQGGNFPGSASLLLAFAVALVLMGVVASARGKGALDETSDMEDDA